MPVEGRCPPRAQANPESRVPALDGLRAIAILLVLLWHLTPDRYTSDGVRSLVFKAADIGWCGVDLFFVLSGFLITGILLRAKDARRSLAGFVRNRLLRIVPAYYLALAIAFFLVPLLPGSHASPPASTQLPYWLYFDNFTQGKQAASNLPVPVGHFWSLAVEMQFYLLWPLVIYHCKARTVSRIGGIVLLLAFVGRGVARLMGCYWTTWYMWTPLHCDGLIVGSLAALAVHSRFKYLRWRAPLWCVAAVAAVFGFLTAWYGQGATMLKAGGPPFAAALTASLPTMLSLGFGSVLLIGLQPNRLSEFLGHPVFRPLALYSYGVYIAHYMLIDVFIQTFSPALLRQWVPGRDAPVYLFLVLSGTISYLVAMLSYHLFEARFLQWKVRSRPGAGPVA
jgi:peptidoglycan/LPS O-acetylase OafA/YrhL